MRIIFLSDLHIGSLPANENSNIYRFFDRVEREKPDYIIFGGDIIDWHSCWEPFLSLYKRKFGDLKTGILLGNHDFWTYGDSVPKKREDVYDYVFGVCKRFDVNFLEEQPFIDGKTLLCGTGAWYDYSVKPDAINKEFLIVHKGKYNNDGNFLFSDLSDEEYAEKCNKRLFSVFKKNLKMVDSVYVFTHIPVFKECVVPAPPHFKQQDWEMGNCYFYNLTLGEKLSKNKKLKLVVSGHIHRYMRGVSSSGIEYVTNGSDYHRPEMTIIDIDGEDKISIKRG